MSTTYVAGPGSPVHEGNRTIAALYLAAGASLQRISKQSTHLGSKNSGPRSYGDAGGKRPASCQRALVHQYSRKFARGVFPEHAARKLQILVRPLAQHIFLERPAQKSNDDGKHGGGGTHQHLPASLGQLPTSNLQITPPTTAIFNRDPIISSEPTVLSTEPIRLSLSELKPLGDPFWAAVLFSNGPGVWSGIGSGKGSGVGADKAAGYGAKGSLGAQKIGGEVTASSVLYRVRA